MASDQPIRVLVVDDSALMRKVLADLLGGDPRIEIVGTAKDGLEAIELVRSRQPDVVTLDVEMPRLSGIDAIPAILAIREVPIVMVSSYTHEGAEVTLEALERGAVDFMPKPDKNQITQLRAARELLTGKVIAAAQSRVRRGTPRAGSVAAARPATPAVERAATSSRQCVGIGISTGGPQALTYLVARLEPPLPPILVVQHMPAQFTPVLAQRLDRLGRVRVKEAEPGDLVLPDQILVANGGYHLMLAGRPPRTRVLLNDDPPVSGHKPSVDVLFRSLAQTYQDQAVAVIMTGMGRDGAEGCKQVMAAGGQTLGQNEATSVVYGMNKVAFEEGGVQMQFALEELPGLLKSLMKV